MASDVAVGLAVLAAAKTEQRLKREAEQRRIEEERRRRELAARIKHIDRRAAALGAILAELAELDRLRSLIAMLIAEIPAEPTSRLSAFLAWAKDHLAKREGRLSAQALEDRFAAERLFGDDDHHDFMSSRWY